MNGDDLPLATRDKIAIKMKRIFLPLFLGATIALVLLLFKPQPKSPIVFRQTSEKAIFNLKGQEQIDAFFEQGFRVESPYSNPQTIVRISGNGGPVAVSKLTIESPGDVFVIGKGGVIVGETANLDWGTFDNTLEFLPSGEVFVINPDGLIVGKDSVLNNPSSQSIPAGNVYALAINEGGSVRTVEQNGRTRKPMILKSPEFKDAPVISDE